MSKNQDTLLATRFAALAPEPLAGTGTRFLGEQAPLRRAIEGLTIPAWFTALVDGPSSCSPP